MASLDWQKGFFRKQIARADEYATEGNPVAWSGLPVTERPTLR